MSRRGNPWFVLLRASRSTDNFMIAIWFHGEKNVKQDPYAIMQCLLFFIPDRASLAYVPESQMSEKNRASLSFHGPKWLGVWPSHSHADEAARRSYFAFEFWAEPWLQLWIRTSHKDFGDNSRELKSWAWFVHNLCILMRQWLSVWVFNLMDMEGSFLGSWMPSSFIVGTVEQNTWGRNDCIKLADEVTCLSEAGSTRAELEQPRSPSLVSQCQLHSSQQLNQHAELTVQLRPNHQDTLGPSTADRAWHLTESGSLCASSTHSGTYGWGSTAQRA